MTDTFKDYYKILGLPKGAAFAEIKSAYRDMSIKWHPDKNPGVDVTAMMQDINEAYAILRDEAKRVRYDREYELFYHSQYNGVSIHPDTGRKWAYRYDVQDEELKEDIKQARKQAEDLVDEFLKSFKTASRNAAKGAWEGIRLYILGIVIISILGSIIMAISAAISSSQNTPAATELGTNVPEGWNKYIFGNNSFSIYVPNTVELQKGYDAYTRFLEGLGYQYDNNAAIFQQKGLKEMTAEAFSHYCRILVQHFRQEAGSFCRPDETYYLDEASKADLKELVDMHVYSGGFKLLNEPTYRWIDIGGTKAIEIKYRRTGTDDYNTCVSIYLLSNYDELVELVVSYREQEAYMWKSDFDKIITTFKWN